MREIKFRVWSESEQRYVYGLSRYLFGSDDNEKCTLYIPQDFKAIFEQYAGLKDKNGKEIYEGDIVDDGYSRICKIRWSEHFTAFEAVNENDGYMSNIWFVAKYGEVIGNIHENAELLG